MKKANFNRIKEVVRSKGIKQTWMAEQLGITFRQFNSYANNKSQPSIPTLFDIAGILNCRPSELINDIPNTQA